MEARTEKTRLKKIEAALKLDPDCADALMMLADICAQSPEQHIDLLRNAVAAGERSLGGPEFIRQHKGHFWSLLETRPYMRARAELAAALMQAGDFAGAMREYEACLVLNPGDHQGLRYMAVGLALELGDFAKLEKLLTEYDEESAAWLWARVAQRFLSGDVDGATRALREAEKLNPHVRQYLSGRKPHPKRQIEFYSHGDESEAIMCLDCIGRGWKAHPTLVAWLRDQPEKA